MTANDLKTIVMGEYIYGKGYTGLFTEAWNSSDVLGVRRSGYTVEFEIKVDKEDLKGEICCIRRALGEEPSRKNIAKLYKHQRYLGTYVSPWGNIDASYRPNYFYFVVPIEFEQIAIEGVRGTPYGVLCNGHWEYTLHFLSGDQQRTGVGLKESVKAKPIHKNKITPIQMMDLVRKASTELYETRRKLVAHTDEGMEDWEKEIRERTWDTDKGLVTRVDILTMGTKEGSYPEQVKLEGVIYLIKKLLSTARREAREEVIEQAKSVAATVRGQNVIDVTNGKGFDIEAFNEGTIALLTALSAEREEKMKERMGK